MFCKYAKKGIYNVGYNITSFCPDILFTTIQLQEINRKKYTLNFNNNYNSQTHGHNSSALLIHNKEKETNKKAILHTVN